jgi:2-isopropylmalate synthase
LGYQFKDDEDLNRLFAKFKELADKKHEVFDEDLQALVSDAQEVEQVYRYKGLSSQSESGKKPTATVNLLVSGEAKTATAEGSGPVDAAFKAIESMVQSASELKLYSVNAITSGTDSQGEVTVRLEKNGRIVNGSGADTDIIVASAKAYINALNILAQQGGKSHPQKEGV